MKIFILLTNNIKFGDEGENLAIEYLKTNGFQILDTKWRFGHKEIDIICQKDNYLIFIEVKSRKNNTLINAEASVNYKKQEHLFIASSKYIEEKNLNLDSRFDIITIYKNSNNKIELNHIIDAFYPYQK